ncbi:hypothetical protein [Plantactinospora sp. KLBMP9567]|uniref:hypothetical protein n=1 Tax=Plantactinospora sp. KLBMP9567 TaxID=3085900 RepID=UPI0029828F94|nr:hypothetical protein [Plantactinospora sp. KLBMP9567]MDW5324195.1 hypothetical protein [Plantactinospora sp. KLBMP9567]
MHPFQAAQQIAQTREVDAAALIHGRCDLRGYPYRHLAVVAGSDLPMPRTTGIPIARDHHTGPPPDFTASWLAGRTCPPPRGRCRSPSRSPAPA